MLTTLRCVRRSELACMCTWTCCSAASPQIEVGLFVPTATQRVIWQPTMLISLPGRTLQPSSLRAASKLR
jgi:hypothetical protein